MTTKTLFAVALRNDDLPLDENTWILFYEAADELLAKTYAQEEHEHDEIVAVRTVPIFRSWEPK